jgi:formamidopyrimidine-DNA glycosylase
VHKTGPPPNGGVPGALVPELPDVEGFRRVLARHAAGKRIEAVDVLDPGMVKGAPARALAGALAGRSFGEPRRHGKWVIAPVDGVEVLMHFGMTGLLEWRDPGEERHRHDRVVFACEDGELRYRNMRKFGSVRLARDERERELGTGRLGPDAHGLGHAEFEELLGRRRGSIKAALMDQTLLAGVGNLLADEILWRARVNPRTPVPSLSRQRRDRLYQGLRDTIRESLPAERVPHGERWLTRVRDQREARCPRCGARLRKETVAGRTACWCPRCQRR